MPSLEKYYFKTLLFEKSSLKECIEDCYIMLRPKGILVAEDLEAY